METIKTYGVERLPFEKLSTKGKLFHALIHNGKLTPSTANTISDSTEATRRLREIRQDHPLRHEKVQTKSGYCFKYFFDTDYIKEVKDYIKGIKEDA